jgi:hypothetical protein
MRRLLAGWLVWFHLWRLELNNERAAHHARRAEEERRIRDGEPPVPARSDRPDLES